MSAINKALSELVENTSPSEITKAEIPSVPRGKPWLWLVAGFSLSLALGGWAVSQSPTFPGDVLPAAKTDVQRVQAMASERAVSPTSKITPEINQVVYTKPAEKQAGSETHDTHGEKLGAKMPPLTPKVKVSAASNAALPAAQVTTASKQRLSNAATTEPVELSSMHIEQVELTHKQLSLKALSRAEKALESNDLNRALSAYTEALRYQPMSADIRQKLAALYFGKGDTRKAYELIQEGINLDTNNQELRLALSKLLLKAKQPQAALSPLVHLPPMPGRDYLAMRAALAQKQKQNEIALESYKLLTQREPENARWWLGLAIQQERALSVSDAISSYHQALTHVGISNQSQAFVRERLTILRQLEKTQ